MKIELTDFGYSYPPVRKHHNDAGSDVHSVLDINLYPHQTVKIPLGFGVKIPDGYVGFLMPRSGLSSLGVVAQNPPIDSGYRGELIAIVSNLTDYAYAIKEGDRIAQLVIVPVVLAEFEENVGDKRGEGGFGSTGI